jgi:phosphatidylserine/phosphatidylglycerophosphate/cardiolipin synthase-like enzyme
MATSDYFLEWKSPDVHSFAASEGNDVTVFDDNNLFFASILSDISSATDTEHFIYFVGWWTDLDIPLGDPKAQPTPPTFREKLTELAKGRQTTTWPGTPENSGGLPPNNPGPEVCCMEWQQKSQIDWKLLVAFSAITPMNTLLPNSIFGAPTLASINLDSTRFVSNLRGKNKGILDNATRIFGSHHQKFVVILNEVGLVAYVGSTDFNSDRLYTTGDRSAKNPPPNQGAPLNDVNIRIVGPAAADLLRTFVDRWGAHNEGKDWKLKGATFAPKNKAPSGGVTAQVTHTYGVGYPFSYAVRTAADAQLKLVQTAEQYVYYEDQYLIGNPDIALELMKKLTTNNEFVVIAVMTAEVIVDLKSVWLGEKRSDFWRPLHDSFGPSENNRVLLFEMLNDQGSDTGAGAYLHNKMTIADDQVVTVGSVNFSRRSWTHDSEVMVSLGGNGGTVPIDFQGSGSIAHKVRLMRWARHLGLAPTAIDRWPDALAAWQKVPSASHVRPWKPSLINPLGPRTLEVYKKVYDVVVDPA